MRFTSEDGPKPDPAVLRLLKQVDPTVYPVWRNWYMDMRTGERLYRENGEPIHYPQWYIVKECRDGVHRVLFSAQYFDYRIPHRLRSDAGRHLRAQEINRMLDDQKEAAEKAIERNYAEQQAEFISANRKKLRTVFEGDNLKRPIRKRDQVISSYSGQKNRTSGRDSIVPSAKEMGFDVPWEEASGE